MALYSRAGKGDVDDEILIAAVQTRPEVYDRQHKNYHNRTYIKQTWDKIGKEVGAEGHVCRGRWQAMRDYFHKILRATKEAAQDGTPYKRKKWYLYDQMSFLIPTCYENEVNDIIMHHKDEGDELMASELDEIQCDLEAQSPTASVYSEDVNNGLSIYQQQFRKRKQKTPSSSFASEDKSNSQHMDVNSCTGGYSVPSTVMNHNEMFFRSLVPTMEKLDDIQTIEFKIEVQSLLLKYLKSSKKTTSGMKPTSSLETAADEETESHVDSIHNYKAEYHSGNFS